MNIQPDLVLAELAELPLAESRSAALPAARPAEEVTTDSSWLFRLFSLARAVLAGLLGIFSLVILLAILASLPLVNLLVLGYLFEVSKRVAQRRGCKETLIGIRQARLIGGALLGTWLLLVPIRYLSHLAFEAELVDPGGAVASRLNLLQSVLTILIVAHIGAALLCGGKLRYFFWPLIAPLSLAVWLVRKLAGQKFFKQTLRWTTNWACPGLADDICRVPPIVDWFLPAIFLRKMGRPNLVSETAAAIMRGFRGLRLEYYFRVGLLGFIGTLIWLVLPTLLLAGATLNQESLISVSAGILGTIIAIPVVTLLPILQTQFAMTGRLKSFFEIANAIHIFRAAPVWHFISWLLVVLLALPLYLLKIETVPSELLWMLSLVFLIFILPSRILMGWAHARALKRARPRSWWLVVPATGLILIISSFYVVVLTTTRYLSWNGAFSLFENHLFLLPTPFWL